MASPSTFRAVAGALQDYSVQLSQRANDPSGIIAEAKSLLAANIDLITPTNDSLDCAPRFLRAVSSIYRADPLPPTLAQKLTIYADAACARTMDFNDLSGMTSACLSLHSRLALQPQATPSQQLLKSLVSDMYRKTVLRMRCKGVVHTNAVVNLLRSCDEVYHTLGESPLSTTSVSGGIISHHPKSNDADGGAQRAMKASATFFKPVGTEMHSLLPTKAKYQMEAKIQRSGEAREILKMLRSLTISRVDAGMLIVTMSDTGLYDEELTNTCCEVLRRDHPLISSQQWSHVIHGLGVLQHRQVHQRFFASCVKKEEVTAEGFRKFALGLACLQLTYPGQGKMLVDGMFLHARRYPEHDIRGVKADWYIDTAFALACLNHKSHKFAITAARRARKGLGQLPTIRKLRFLYALGYVKDDAVDPSLRDSFAKVGKCVEILAKVLESNVAIHDGPLVTNALLYCGIRDHPLVPKVSLRHATMNPVQQILSCWSTRCDAPKVAQHHHNVEPAAGPHVVSAEGHSRDSAVQLAESIRPHHFSESSSSEIAHVFSALAFQAKCRVAQDVDQERYRNLCDAAEQRISIITKDDAMVILKAVQHIGLGVMAFKRFREALLEKLWNERFSLKSDQQALLCDLLDPLAPHVERAVDLIEFAAGQVGL